MNSALLVSDIRNIQTDAWLSTSRSEGRIRNSLEIAGGRRIEISYALSILLDTRERKEKKSQKKKNELDSPCPQRIPSLAETTGIPTNSSNPGQIVTEANWKSAKCDGIAEAETINPTEAGGRQLVQLLRGCRFYRKSTLTVIMKWHP